jgi:uncharacterized protein YjiS (DUF1127 family)
MAQTLKSTILGEAPDTDATGSSNSGAKIMTFARASGTTQYARSNTRAGFIRRLFKSLQRSFAIAKNRRLLQGMPGYVLKDIGINRSEIDVVVASVVDGVPDPSRRPRGRS